MKNKINIIKASNDSEQMFKLRLDRKIKKSLRLNLPHYTTKDFKELGLHYSESVDLAGYVSGSRKHSSFSSDRVILKLLPLVAFFNEK